MPEPTLTRPLIAPLPPLSGSEKPDRSGFAILLMCTVSLLFAIQDGFSKQLGAEYPPLLVVMIRFWVFAIFVAMLVARKPGGLRAAVRSKRPVMQIVRGVLLAAEVVVMVEAFVRLGLVETHALFTVYPLMVAALSGPVLGEKVGWRRWLAIGAGFVGILIILQPGARALSVEALLPLSAAVMFAIYGLLTRKVARDDPAMVSFFWTATAGAVGMTVIGLKDWQWLAPIDWLWMACLCVVSITSHYLLIRAYELAEASVLQPFAYSQLVFVSVLGVVIFGETLHMNVVIGATIVVGAGLFTLWRSQVRARQQAARTVAEAGRTPS